MRRQRWFLGLAAVLVGCGSSDSDGLFQVTAGAGGMSGSSGQGGSILGGSGGAAGEGAAGDGAAGDGAAGDGAGGDPFGGAGTSSSGAGGVSAGGSGGANTGGANTGGANTGGANTGGANTGGSGGANASGSAGANTGGASGSTSSGGQGGTTVEPTGPVRRARVARLTELSVWQAVKVTLVSDDVPVKKANAPVVAGRAALVRAYVAPGQGFTARTLRAELRVDDGLGNVSVLTDEHMVSGASTDAALGSSFAFELTATQMTPKTRLSVTLIDDTAEPDDTHEVTSAELPAGGAPLAVGAQAQTAPLRITLVPFRYDTDGSKRLPDTSPEQLARYEATLRAAYPITDVVLKVHAVIPWNKSTTLSGNVNFGTMNSLLVDLKSDENAPNEEYYYGLISPDVSRAAYCKYGCVTGQSYVVDDADDGDIRVGGGMGFGTDDSTWTLAHELGHLHGRSHSPCDTSSYDPDFPYKSGNIGVWGYDQRTKTLLGSTKNYDVMSYCDPLWISDYTYSALFDRVQELGQLSKGNSLMAPVTTWSTLIEDEDGAFEVGPVVRRRGGHEGRMPLSHGGAVWFLPAP